jgi:hypothetical protein
MREATINRIYQGLKSGKKVNMTKFIKEEQKEYIDAPGDKPDKQVMRIYLEMTGTTDPAITVSKYRQKKLIESHFYYLDQKDQLRQLLHSWLNI